MLSSAHALEVHFTGQLPEFVRQGYEFLVTIDCDGQHEPHFILQPGEKRVAGSGGCQQAFHSTAPDGRSRSAHLIYARRQNTKRTDRGGLRGLRFLLGAWPRKTGPLTAVELSVRPKKSARHSFGVYLGLFSQGSIVLGLRLLT